MRKKILALILVVSLDVLALKAYAEFYHYIDSNGTVHCVDNISSVPEQYRTQLKNAESLSDISVVGVPGPAGDEPPSINHAAGRPEKTTLQYNGTVDIFVTSWCGYCKQLERFLDSKGIHYTAYDIEKDGSALKQYKALGRRGVPVTRIGASVVSGYNPDAILKAIERER